MQCAGENTVKKCWLITVIMSYIKSCNYDLVCSKFPKPYTDIIRTLTLCK